MSDKQYQPLFDYLHKECGVLVLPNGKSDIIEILRHITASQPPAGMPSLDKPILTDEDVRAWEESETSRPPAGFEKIPFDPNRLKQMEGHEERAEKSWEEIQKRLAQPPAVKGAVVWTQANGPLPAGRHREIMHVKYKGSPELLICYHGTWYWKDDKPSPEFMVDKDSWSAIEYLAESPTAAGEQVFQERVSEFMTACFGSEIPYDVTERNHRFLEESLELVQSTGCTASEAHQLVDYVFNRPVGEIPQEVGGVMVTLAALCSAAKLDMNKAGETELKRVWGKIEVIRAKQAAKPKHSPLPLATAAEDGKEAMSMLQWMLKNDIERSTTGREGEEWVYPPTNDFCTTAQLYDIFKNRNK